MGSFLTHDTITTNAYFSSVYLILTLLIYDGIAKLTFFPPFVNSLFIVSNTIYIKTAISEGYRYLR